MARKLLMIRVRGRDYTWAFEFYGDPAHLQEWLRDGLEVMEVVNTVPEWVPAGCVRAWCWLQDVFNFKNPFRS